MKRVYLVALLLSQTLTVSAWAASETCDAIRKNAGFPSTEKIADDCDITAVNGRLSRAADSACAAISDNADFDSAQKLAAQCLESAMNKYFDPSAAALCKAISNKVDFDSGQQIVLSCMEEIANKRFTPQQVEVCQRISDGGSFDSDQNKAVACLAKMNTREASAPSDEPRRPLPRPQPKKEKEFEGSDLVFVCDTTTSRRTCGEDIGDILVNRYMCSVSRKMSTMSHDGITITGHRITSSDCLIMKTGEGMCPAGSVARGVGSDNLVKICLPAQGGMAQDVARPSSGVQ